MELIISTTNYHYRLGNVMHDDLYYELRACCNEVTTKLGCNLFMLSRDLARKSELIRVIDHGVEVLTGSKIRPNGYDDG